MGGYRCTNLAGPEAVVLFARHPTPGKAWVSAGGAGGRGVKQSGSLCVVGLGPGAAALMTGQAQEALRRADVVIGYEGYLAWVTDVLRNKECIALPLTQELTRAQLAVDRALAGQAVCVISSGDAGIYGMASLVLEVIEQRQAAALLTDVLVVPGGSAVNACASLLGAPLGHDFAWLNLSDRFK